jgi:hypothetical protein
MSVNPCNRPQSMIEIMEVLKSAQDTFQSSE